MGAGVVEGAGDDLGRAVVAAHRVDGDADARRRPVGAGRGLRLGHRVSARRRRRGWLELDGQAALVVAAVRAGVVRQLHLVAVRALLERRHADGEVRAALALAGMRDASLGYTHEVAGSFGSSRMAMRWLADGASGTSGRRCRTDGGVYREIGRSPSVASSGAESPERLEPRVDVLVGMVVDAFVERPPQTMHRPGQSGRHSGAIGSASWIASRTGVSRSSSWWSVRRATSGSSSVGERPAGREVERRQELLLESQLDREVDVAQAAAALERERGRRGRRAARIPRFVRSSRTRAVDRRARREVVAEVDRRRRGSRDVRSAPRSSPRSPATFQVSGPSTGRRRGHRVVRRRLRLVLPGLAVDLVIGVAGSLGRRSAARRSSRSAIPFLMLWSVLTTSPSSPTSTLTAYSSAPRRISSASRARVGDDLAALGLGRLGQPALVDEEGGLLLGPGDDPLGLFLGLLDDPLALGVDPLGGADLLRDGDPQLVDEAERRVLVDDDVRGQRQLLAVGDERLEALDEEDDVDRSALQVAAVDPSLRLASIIARGAGASAPRRVPRRAAVRRRPGPSPTTSPPKAAISLTRLELT